MSGGSGPAFESTGVAESSTEYPAIRYRRRAGATDLTYRIQISADLVTWRDNNSPGGPHTVEVSATPADEGMEWVMVRGTIATDLQQQQYFRVLVESPLAAPVASRKASKKARRRLR